ncbi:FMN-binding domain-containing protein [Clostridium pasteurianum DSM 525 = ATCC 6013]|uniref:FMN-binding domain protein n=1 Tax=Clostridium pasteurianum DSM 525 = ATCC 6013 TaxID=1262449 RepID=A0A0H3J0Q0_CLOPA|nr:FMN-binding protein [Clostridium pasteurianum]AJA47421.1 FMN-binding domain-containing protein [Clostridium pasteurianum DSM 525 = ATCC 6013]AJA51409.1 FMN-binding domain-containing protein [Clostridium pasteurianum DSM 525 = ATCC 6013]AOZ74748.1 FMN-binding protein [Clostridium pasteurianum DSM 525 = ATCC 6013]AOZ78544.1 FMN-binding protein [Clostridium pasteurianum]ELP58756.1 FMN-binding domain-containing protein [Clostridium pasteurianum DSM 525 = ATCC 6013]
MKRIPKIQIFRVFIQIIFLFLLPGLFALTFSQLGQIYSMIINGKFNFVEIFPNLAGFLTIFILTLILSRFFCGWICAFGAFNDFIYIIVNKVFKTNFKINKNIDNILKYLKYAVLLFIIIFIWTIGSKSFDTFSPWNAFAQISDLPQVILNYPVGLIILILIALGAVFIERFFCRYLCPLGAIFSIISKLSIFKINKPSDKCGKCRACTNNCSMGIELYKLQKVRGGECINCLRCIEKCPRNNTKTTICDENINPALASSIAIVAFTGLYSANNVAGKVVSRNLPVSVSSNTSSSMPKVKYTDGTYSGTGTGFRGGSTEISVTVKSGKIANIETVSNGDTPDYYERAYSTIQSEIISAQSTEVDVVSGATYSSNGIISAVKNALNNATADNSSQSNTASSSDNNSSLDNTASSENSTITNNDKSTNISSTTGTASTDSNTENTTTAESKYRDGTYTGTGTGFRGGTTEISVIVKNGKITDIKTVSDEDTPDYYEGAYNSIQNEIISSQSAQVDVVSGATYSSNGIISAVEDALSKAKS